MLDTDDLLNPPRLIADIWLCEAEAGRFWVPSDISGDVGLLLYYALRRRYYETDGHGPVSLFVETHSGDHQVYAISQLLEQFAETTAVADMAISAGLVLLLSCKERVAVSARSKFGWHGSWYKPGQDKSRMDDAARIDWMVERTTAPREFWAEKAVSGETFEFRAQEALELGVIHRIEEGHLL